MPRALVALGANLGDRAAALAEAVNLLAARPEITNLRASRWYETAPVGGPGGQGAFLNGAVAFDTSLAPKRCLTCSSRSRRGWAVSAASAGPARTIDLDLLLYGDLAIHTPRLTVPHPRMAFRRFVLEPAAEVAAESWHPGLGRSVGQLLANLETVPAYLALLGPPASGKSALAVQVASTSGARLIADPMAGTPAAAPGDSPSRLLERQIQFLDRRRTVLDRATWPRSERLTVSDFYFDQALVYARRELDQAGHEAFCRAWHQARGHVVEPSLLVVLDEPGPPIGPARESEATTLASSGRAGWPSEELASLATRAGLGPVLYAGRQGPAAQLEEIEAAIAAMYPGRPKAR